MSKKRVLCALVGIATIGTSAVLVTKSDVNNSGYDYRKDWIRYYGTIVDESPVRDIKDGYAFTINISDIPDKMVYRTFILETHKDGKVLEARVDVGDFVTVTGNSDRDKEFGSNSYTYIKNGQVEVISKHK